MRLGLGLGLKGSAGGGASASPLETLQSALAGVTGAGIFDFTTATTDDTSFANLLDGGATLGSQFNRKFTSVSATDGGLRVAEMLFQPGEAPASGLMTVVFQFKASGTPSAFNLTPEIAISDFGNPPTPVWVDGVLQTTRAEVKAILNNGDSHTVRLTGLPDGEFGGGSAPWSVRRAALIPEAAGSYTDAVAAAETYVADGI